MPNLSEHDRALVQAFRESYRAAGGSAFDGEEDAAVLDVLRAYGVVTERQAEIVGSGQAVTDLEGEGNGYA
jgi:hypothetical protein